MNTSASRAQGGNGGVDIRPQGVGISALYALYSGILLGWGVLLAPYFLYSAWRFKKYLPGWRQRFGYLPETLRRDARRTVWFHSCSVGETLSVQPLAESLLRQWPDARFVFSTITKTGQAVARERFGKYGQGNTFYFPIDLASVAGRVLDWIQPSLLVIIDTEIWPNLLRESDRRGIPVVLANGRISAASFRNYRRVRFLLKTVFRNYSMFLMQSPDDAARIRALGAPDERIFVSGNLKYDKDLVEKDVNEAQGRDLAKALELNVGGPVIVAGSTHGGEEEILFESLRRVRDVRGLEQTRLLIAPRHPERFDAVAGMAARAGFRIRRRTQADGKANAEILLLDTIGELAAAYRFATVVFVGGTLIPRGGQNVMEPALYAKPIVIGPSTDNFAQIVKAFRDRSAVRQIAATHKDRQSQVVELTDAFVHLLRDVSARESMGRAAHAVLEQNKGAVKVTVEKITSIFEANWLLRSHHQDTKSTKNH